jgi:hypothetical protein
MKKAAAEATARQLDWRNYLFLLWLERELLRFAELLLRSPPCMLRFQSLLLLLLRSLSLGMVGSSRCWPPLQGMHQKRLGSAGGQGFAVERARFIR